MTSFMDDPESEKLIVDAFKISSSELIFKPKRKMEKKSRWDLQNGAKKYGCVCECVCECVCVCMYACSCVGVGVREREEERRIV